MAYALNRRFFIAGTAALVAAPLRAMSSGHRLIRRGDRLFIAAKVNGVAVEALLDSGAELSVADPAFAARLALANGTNAIARGSGAATTQAKLIPHVRIEAAGIILADAMIGVIDLGDVGKRLIGARLDMIVGRDLFDASRLWIDIPHGRIAAVPRVKMPMGVKLDLVTADGNELAPITIEGKAAKAVFDLGNGTGVLVSRKFAQQYLLDGRTTGETSGGGLGGARRQQTLNLASLTVAGKTFRDVPARIDDAGGASDANIGVGILQHFGITVDFAQHLAWLA